MKTWLIQFSYKEGNGWAIVNAHSLQQAKNIFISQSQFSSKDVSVCSAKELRYFGEEMQLVYEGSATTFGKSSYDIAVLNGYKGTEQQWLDSLKGEKGDPGQQGPKGPKGDPFEYSDFTPEQLEGLKGPKGDKGDQGPKGVKGDKGDKGQKGDTGPMGPQGPQGVKGDRGVQGPKGDTGPQGEQGIQGEKGEKGDKGDPGDETMVEVTYGVTTFVALKALIDEGKIPYFYKDLNTTIKNIKFEFSAYIYHSNDSIHSLRFVSPAVNDSSNRVHNYKIFVTTDNVWSDMQDNPPEITYNRTNTIVGYESNTSRYPSTKAVADYVAGNKDVFWATYGTTTRAEVVAAVTAGKIAACKYGDYVYYCSVINTDSTTTNIYFESVEGNRVRAIYVSGSNQWGGPMGPTLEQTSNKVTSLSDQSTDVQYPSAKAVYDEIGPINDLLDDILGDIDAALDVLNGEVI